MACSPFLAGDWAPTIAIVDSWLKEAPREFGLNERQLDIVKRAANRVEEELRDEQDHTVGQSEPLVWLIHGRPGTGKTHVIKASRDLFERVLRWAHRVEFQFAAYQATMACNIGGDTAHHAAGLNPFLQDPDGSVRMASMTNVAKRITKLRWLILDEVSTISAPFLSDLESQYRHATREAGTYKKRTADGEQSDRDFGGLNVIYAGDFWQLDPPGMDGIPPTRTPSSLRAEGSGRSLEAPFRAWIGHAQKVPGCDGIG